MLAASIDTAPPPAEVHIIEPGACVRAADAQIGHRARVIVANDNDDDTLPDLFRAWWHVRLDDVPTSALTEVTVQRIAHPEFYLPMYSYDQLEWRHVPLAAVSRDATDTMAITMPFTQPTVWLAQYAPYGEERLEALLSTFACSPWATVDSLGVSQQGRPLPMVTITDDSVDEANKKRIWVHARTHPGEVASSFVAEGLLNFMLGDSAEAADARRRYIVHVVPILNPDGVAAGNYRTTPQSENLEMMWLAAGATDPSPPQEVALAQRAIERLASTAAPFVSAINLHSSHEPIETRPYLVRHFGPQEAGYTAEEASVWQGQQRLAERIDAAGPIRFDVARNDGGKKFLAHDFPESFWWNTFQGDVMAATFEAVYGRIGANGGWATPADFIELGRQLGQSLCARELP